MLRKTSCQEADESSSPRSSLPPVADVSGLSSSSQSFSDENHKETDRRGSHAIPSSQVTRFSKDEITMYAQWFALNVDVVKAVILQCHGDRGLVLQTLHEVRDAPSSRLPSLRGSIPQSTCYQLPPALSCAAVADVGVQRRSTGRLDALPAPVALSSFSGGQQVVGTPPQKPTFAAPPIELSSPRRRRVSTRSVSPVIVPLASVFVVDNAATASSVSLSTSTLVSSAAAASLLKDEGERRRLLFDEFAHAAMKLWRNSTLTQLRLRRAGVDGLVIAESLQRSNAAEAALIRLAGLLCRCDLQLTECRASETLVAAEDSQWNRLVEGELVERWSRAHYALQSDESAAWRFMTSVAFPGWTEVRLLMQSERLHRDAIRDRCTFDGAPLFSALRRMHAFCARCTWEQRALLKVEQTLRGLWDEACTATMLVMVDVLYFKPLRSRVDLIDEPFYRRTVERAESEAYLALLAIRTTQRHIFDPLIRLESSERTNMQETQAEEFRDDVLPAAEYYSLKLRMIKKHHASVPRLAPNIGAAFSELESARREEIFQQWRLADTLIMRHALKNTAADSLKL